MREWLLAPEKGPAGGKRRAPASRRRTAGRAPAAGSAQPVPMTYLPGSFEIPVAGLQDHAQAVRDTIAAVAAGAKPDSVLLPEPSNAFDRNAVAVHMSGGKVGYIPRTLGAILKPEIAAAAAASGGKPVGCPARIVTGHASPPQIVLMLYIAGLGIDPAALR